MAKSPLSVNRFIIIFSISWLVFMADQAMLFHWFGISLKLAIIDSLISNTLLLLPCLLVMNTLRFYLPGRERYFNIFIWCTVLTVIWILLSRWLLVIFLGNYVGYKEFLVQSWPVRASIGFLILGCVTLISVLWYNWAEQKETDLRKQDAEKLAKEAELYKLRQQLQPHFLFNSLNSISALISIEPEQAKKMIYQLSDFLRGTLKKEEHEWITLEEEIQNLQLYLDIEKVRFRHRLNTQIETDDISRSMFLPPLLLQPVVENAIKFGLYDTVDEIIIHLKAEKQDQNLIVTVQNPFDSETSSPRQGTGFGLNSVQRRLYLLFARTDLLVTEARKNIFTTIVKIPQHVKSDNN